MRRAVPLLVMPLLCAALPLAAQDSTKLAKGDAVKVTAPSIQLDQWPGVFEQWRGDSIAVRGSGADSVLLVLPIGVITSFEVNHGNKKSHGHAWAGAIVGAVAGATLAAASNSCSSGEYYCVPDSEAALAGGVVGGLLGAGIGALIRTNPWEVVELTPAPHVALLPGGRVGVGLSLRF